MKLSFYVNEVVFEFSSNRFGYRKFKRTPFNNIDAKNRCAHLPYFYVDGIRRWFGGTSIYGNGIITVSGEDY